MRKEVEITWVEAYIALSLERKRPHCTGQYKYAIICVSNHMHFSPKIQQSVRSIECSKGSLNLMNTTVLRDNIEKKKNTLEKTLVFFVVFFPCT